MCADDYLSRCDIARQGGGESEGSTKHVVESDSHDTAKYTTTRHSATKSAQQAMP
jgi:hypothetical protein